MLGRVRLPLLIWRVRGLGFTLAAAVAMFAVLMVVPRDAQEIPGRLGIYSFVWPLVPALGAAFLPLVSMRTDSPSDWTAPKFKRRRAVDLALFVVVAGVPVFWRADLSVHVMLRNQLLFVGLSAVAVRLVGPAAAWVPLSCCVMVVWLLGTSDGGTPYSWALPLLPPSSAVAAVASLAVACLGVISYVSAPARD